MYNILNHSIIIHKHGDRNLSENNHVDHDHGHDHPEGTDHMNDRHHNDVHKTDE